MAIEITPGIKVACLEKQKKQIHIDIYCITKLKKTSVNLIACSPHDLNNLTSQNISSLNQYEAIFHIALITELSVTSIFFANS